MKPSLPRFIYFTTEHGQYILCTEYPFIIGQVWKYTNEAEMGKKVRELSKAGVVCVDNYNVLIAYTGNLTDQARCDYGSVLFEMSSFFLSKINERPMGWRRYKIEK